MENDKSIIPDLKLSPDRQKMVDIGYLPIKQAQYIERKVREAALKRKYYAPTYDALIERIQIIKEHLVHLNVSDLDNQKITDDIANLYIALDQLYHDLQGHYSKQT